MPAIRTSVDADNVLTIVMDSPGKPVNTFSPQLLAELSSAIDAVERDKPKAVIFASAKARSFSAGADLTEISKMTREQIADFLATGQSLFNRIAKLPMPTIAAINGDALGGGFELALACRYRVAVDEGSISIGLPEVKIGLIPAWGGTTRLPRTIGLRRALPILLAGKTMPPRKALKAHLIDEVVRREALLAAAKRIVLSGGEPQRAPSIDRMISRLPAARSRILDAAARQTNEKTFGNYPAPTRLLEVVRTGYERGLTAGFDAERQGLIDVSQTDAGRNLLRLFFLRQGAKKRAAEQIHAKPHDIFYAAVIGGGTMGAGIAHAMIRANLPVRLVEVNAQAVSAALGRVKRLLNDDVAAARIDKLAARHAFNRISPTTDWTGLELADFVIEAVVETIEAKRDVFSRLDRHTRPTAVLASNTSSLRVSEMAEATLHPERVVGLHFFNPVAKMPLVEIIRAAHSDDLSLATAVAMAVRLGKTPIIVSDSPGFLVNRILVPYLAEAMKLASEGVPIDRIDLAMKRWGMPMGAFELLDEIGLDVAEHVLRSLATTNPPPKVSAAMAQAMQQRWLGKKAGRGFYVYAKKTQEVNEDLVKTLSGGAPPRSMDDDAIQRRLVQPMVDEANAALREGVVDSPDTIDLATVLGIGLAPFRGGIMRYATTLGTKPPAQSAPAPQTQEHPIHT